SSSPSMRLIDIAALLLLTVLTADAECCKKKGFLQGCCGNGKCNMFCCNCDDGCDDSCSTDYGSFVAPVVVAGKAALAVGGRKKRDIDESRSIAQMRFQSIDTNGDGVLSQLESREFLRLNLDPSMRTKRAVESNLWFVKMDIDGDGFLQAGEFDRSLA
ncbi:hypothetical protein PMAYCL1PPCAC_21448, partial [Pristionchus mayeri]